MISCNKWLFNINIKTSELCDYCKDIDDVPHFFFHCPEVNIFWISILKWLENISNLQLRNSPILEECLIFGFPECNTVVKGKISVNNFCILYIKYYIYTQRLFNNTQLDVYSCKGLLKSVLETEKKICIRNRKTANFEKYNFIYWNI